MWARHWLLLTIATTALVAGAAASTNAFVDIYGLFRSPEHRSLEVFGDERVAKYLLSRRYVPANFEGVLVGSSVSANWDLRPMKSVRLYNESVNGGNIVEQKAILEAFLERGRPRLVLLIVHPYLTASHEFKTVELTPREDWRALGSLSLLDAYKTALKIRLGREPQLFDAAGTQDFGDAAKKLNPDLTAMMKPGEDFFVDPIALQALQDLVATLHARQVPIVFVVPPAAESLVAPKRDAFRKYSELVLATRQPPDQVLDFLGDEYESFRRDEAQFSDGVHLRRSAAPLLVQRIDRALIDLLPMLQASPVR